LVLLSLPIVITISILIKWDCIRH